MASTSSALSALSLEHEHDDLDLEPLRGAPESQQQQQQKKKSAKRQRKNVLIINFPVVLFTLGIFSILIEYTAIADRAARTSGMHPSHLNSDVGGGGGGGAENGGATHLFSSVVDVYEEEEYGEELENGGEATPLPSLAFMPNLPIDELMQINQLFDACMTQKNTVIDGTGAPSSSFPSTLSENDSSELLLEKLRVCPDVDVFVPTAVRGDNEYCQDAAVYTKFLQSRMLPRWVLDKELRDESANRTMTYFDLCPKTPMLFLNHHWDALPSHAKWPSQELKTKKKPVFLMPNIDSTQLHREHLLGADVVLCKTKACFSRVSAWYAQEAQRGNRRDAKVLYTRHTSPNPSVPLQMLNMGIGQKEYGKPKFVHLGGDLKGTKQVLDCWLSRGRELPRLEIFMDDAKYSSGFKSEYDARIRKSENVQVDTRARSPSSLEWSKLVTESTFFLAPSESESYGHTINQARAAGGVVITTDVAPMNELMPTSASSMGVLVHAKRKINPNQFLGSGFTGGRDGLQGGKGLMAEFSGKHVCDAVDTLLRATQEQTRQAMGVHAHRQYFTDMNVFVGAMQELREYARSKSGENAADGASPTPTTKAPEGVQRLGNLRVDTAAFSNPPPAASS